MNEKVVFEAWAAEELIGDRVGKLMIDVGGWPLISASRRDAARRNDWWPSKPVRVRCTVEIIDERSE